MKNKYQRMNKEEKKELKKAFYQTAKGKELKMRYIRLIIIGLIGIAFSIFMIVDGSLKNGLVWHEWLVIAVLSIFSLVFIFSPLKLQADTLNWYAVNGEKKSSNKKKKNG